MKFARILSDLIGLALITAWCISAAFVAVWNKLVASQYLRELVLIGIVCGIIGVGFAWAF